MKCQVLVDWLTFTVKNTSDPHEVIREYLHMEPDLFQEMGFGFNGYTNSYFFNDIRVNFAPRENAFFHDMGVNVVMSGNGCRTFELMSRLGKGDSDSAFPLLFQTLAGNINVNVSRLDIACDDKEDMLDMGEMVRKVQENEINSRMTRRSVVVSWNGTERNGSTVYIGSPSSDFRIRIYDKALEQGEDGHWVRVEMVLRAEHAQGFVDQAVVSETVGQLAAQVINDKFAFIERDDANISRCTVCDWWQLFVDELEAVRLVAREVVQHSVERVSFWIEDQVGPSLAMLFQTMGWPRIYEIAHDAQRRLSDKQVAIVEDYNRFSKARARA